MLRSILFDASDGSAAVAGGEQPAFFADLNLDQVVAAVTAGREEYDLAQYFYAPLRDPDAVRYRHEVLRDLQSAAVLESVLAFAKRMHDMRAHLEQARRFHDKHQRESWFLDAVGLYCDAVAALAGELTGHGVESRGFRGLARHLAGYVESEGFAALAADTRALKADLAEVRYSVHIWGSRVRVGPFEGEPD
ncbi:MAG: MutS-related protein, partial [Thermoleophilaceae bacterium]